MRSASTPHAAPPAAESLIAVRGLSIGYADPAGGVKRVVDDVSFDIAPGAALGIVGESGSGKSTLARALLGYLRAGSRFVSGTIAFHGLDLVRADAAALRTLRGIEVAMVPQNPLASLTYHIRVGRQIEEVLRARAGLPRAAARARALALLAEMGLPQPAEAARRYPHQLSGGQRQRAVIAAALACGPRLLVLDEPTTALDKTTEAQVLDLIVRLRRERGSALVLVTHDLNAVAQVCDRALVMKDGRVVEDGPVAGVFSRPRTAYTASLLASSLRLGGTPGGAHAPAASTAAAAAEPPFLALRGLSFAYRRASWFASARSTAAPTLAEIDLSVGRGEILGVIGESGSGKTTLGGIVAGLLAPTRGAATFDGRPLAGLAAQRPADVRRRIQIVFQDALSSLNPRHTVGASIARPLQLWFGLDRRAARTRAAALLGELGMGAAFLDRFPRQLSGGQQQRVAIARAFAAEPELLICDEITSALDASVQSQVLQQLAMLQERTGTAMIVITHDLAVVWRMAARVVVLQAGRVVEQGETERVFRHPTNPYTAALLHAAGRAERIAAQAPPPVAVA